MKLHSERKPATHSHITRIMSRFLSAEKKYSPILFWSLIVGALTGLVGAVFQLSITKVQDSREYLLHIIPQSSAFQLAASVLFSAVLVYVAFLLVRKIAPETSGSGVHEIEGALDDVRPVRWKNVLPVKFLGGLFSLGGGMVLGREGPTIQMGGNIGKMIADFFKVNKDDTHALIAAGAGED